MSAGGGPLARQSSEAASSSPRPPKSCPRPGVTLCSTALVFAGGSERAPPMAISPIGGSCQSLSSAGMISGRSCWLSRC